MPHDISCPSSRPRHPPKTTVGRRRRRQPRSFRGLLAAALSAALFVAGLVELNLSAAANADAALATTTVTLAPVADSYVTSAAPNRILGFADQIQGSGMLGHHKRAYLRFRLPRLSGETIVKARLVLTRTNHRFAGPLRLRTVANTTWTERGLTWRTAPSVGTIIDSVQTDSTEPRVMLNTPRWAFAGSAVSLALTSPSLTDFVAFRSRESGTGAPALQLVLQPTTSPGASSTASSIPLQSPSVTVSSSPATSTETASRCTISAKLVPSCGYWWGIAPKAHTSTPRDVALAED